MSEATPNADQQGLTLGLLGGYGQLGSEIRRTAAAAGHTVIAPESNRVDIRNEDELSRWVASTQADAWINSAAYTAVDGAEDDVAEATRLNVAGPRNLTAALQAAQSQAPLIYLSTDYVFPGDDGGAPYTEASATHPRSVYGATKLAGETESLAYPNAIVLRISWVFGRHGHNFVKSILRAARRFAAEGTVDKPAGALKVVNDQLGAPCGTRAITQTLLRLIESPINPGLYHMASQPYVSWQDFALAIVEDGVAAGLISRPVDVLPQPTSALNQKATRPADGRLDGSKLQTALGIEAPHWREDLRAMLAELAPGELDA